MSDRPSQTAALPIQLRRALTIALQLGVVVLSNRLAFLLRFDGDLPHRANEAFWATLPWLVAIRSVTFIPAKLYEGLWRHTSIYDLRAIAGGVCASSLAFFLFTQSPLGPTMYPRSIFVIDALLVMFLLGGMRMARRLSAELSRRKPEKRVLIFGAGDAGELIVRDMKHSKSNHYHPIGFIDDDPAKLGQSIHGVPVLGAREDLPRILKRYGPDEVLLALPGAGPAAVRAIIRSLEPFKIPIKTVPNMRDLLDGKTDISQIRSLAVEDLLARAPVGLDPDPVKRLIAGRRVLVTGAGGSIGSELCRQISKLQPASLVMFERYENSLHAIRLELEDASRAVGVRAVIGDVTDAVRVAEVFEQHQPEIVFHAAAHKHVPLMEENPCEAIKNNVRGTRLLADAAERYGVDRFIVISTDKAVNPTSVMGASKRLAELVVQAKAVGSGTSFAVVRFGNVLASNGSVIPRFIDQIKKGGPVTITHPEMRRFFMLIPEAVQLVLHAAGQAASGEIYVLEMGEQVKLLDMARDLIRLSGFVPEEEIPITFVGLRPGEKLYEELVGGGENVEPSAVEKILRVTSRISAPENFAGSIAAVERAAAEGRRDAVINALQTLAGLSSPGGTETRVEVEATPPVAALESRPAAFVPAAAGILDQSCPHCQSGTVRRSHARTLAERLRRAHSDQRLFRCETCNWRGWLIPLEFNGASAGEPTAIPDLAAIDHAVRGVQMPLRPSFSPRDLQ